MQAYSFFQRYLKTRKGFKYLSVVVALLLFTAVYRIYADVLSPNVVYSEAITIRTGQSFENFIFSLETKGILQNHDGFRRLGKLLNLDKKLKPGRYQLEEGMSNMQLIRLLISGKQQTLNVVLKQADRIQNLSGFFSRQLEIDSFELLQTLKDPILLNELGFDSNNVISLFIPNTYNFYWNTNPKQLVTRMQREYKNFWTKERILKTLELNLSQQQVATLASIVQKETNKLDEMPIVAGVYLNRLHAGMPLQADPTVVFAWNDSEIRRVTSYHTAIESPFNTYKYPGLPPGPICMPSVQAIDAVLNAAKHEYYYFCARQDFSGYHNFAATLRQHQNNARQYQMALNQRGIN